MQHAPLTTHHSPQQAATDAGVGGGILEAKGMRILLQTARRHAQSARAHSG